MNEEIVKKIFPNMFEEIHKGNCPMCRKKIGVFKDFLSEKEFKISGMCQICQDGVFK